MKSQIVSTFALGVSVSVIFTGLGEFVLTMSKWVTNPSMAVDSKYLGLYSVLLTLTGSALFGFLLWLRKEK